ncbi:MAG: D-alanyl-D-alanine carboxypeptidase/D-alanyl-D-alanine-endopeptidase [Gemmataceae bacterium]
MSVARPLLALIVCLSPAVAAEPLAAKLDAVVSGPDYKHAHWGLYVADLKTGETVFARDPDKLFAPASTTKLFSCAAALVALGPDHKFVTPVYRRGEVGISGTLRGDLILVASGDPSFGGRTKDDKLAFKDHDHTYANSSLMDSELTDTDPLAALNDLAKQVKASGITAVTGDVLIDDRLFASTRSSGSGPDAVTPIIVNDNVLDVTIAPADEAGKPAKVTVRPQTAVATVDIDVTTGVKGSPPLTLLDTIGPRQFAVRGSVPVGHKPVVRILPIDDPAGYARGMFIEALRRQGVRVTAPVARPAGADLPAKDEYAKLTQVASHTSPPFSEVTTVTLKVSHNLYASALPCLVAAKKGKRTLADGLREQGKILKELGVDVKSISFGGGAGGANADWVTPRTAVQLLCGMARRPEWAAYKAGLPSLGVDGTLVDVVGKDSPARGKVFAKTGTLFWSDLMNNRSLLTSKALAGVVTTKSGRELAFGFYVNGVPLPAGVPTSREGKVLGKLAEIVYEHGE